MQTTALDESCFSNYCLFYSLRPLPAKSVFGCAEKQTSCWGGGGKAIRLLPQRLLHFCFVSKDTFTQSRSESKATILMNILHFWCVWIVLCTIKPVILFGILGNYLFLRIWENILIKIGKISAKMREIGGNKGNFWMGNDSHCIRP